MASHVLVIDSSTAIQKVIKIAFVNRPIKLVPARTTAEVVKAFDDVAIDAVIMDFAFAVEFLEGCTELQGLALLPKVVLYSSLDFGAEQKLKAGDFAATVKKPFDSKQLVSLVLKLVGRSDEDPAFLSQIQPVADAQWNLPPIRNPLQPSADPYTSNEMSLEDAIREPFVGLPNIALNDQITKGKRAFDPPSVAGRNWSGSDVDSENVRSTAGRKGADAGPQTLEGLGDGWEKVVREAVEDYCRRNFPQIAREVLSQEIRRLAEEKSRFLMDL